MSDFNKSAYLNSLKLVANFSLERLKFMESVPALQFNAFKTFLWLSSVLISAELFFIKQYHPTTPIALAFITLSLATTSLVFVLVSFPLLKLPLHVKMPLAYAKQAYKLSKESENPEIEFLVDFINSIEDSMEKWGEIVERQKKFVRLIRYLTLLAVITFIISAILA